MPCERWKGDVMMLAHEAIGRSQESRSGLRVATAMLIAFAAVAATVPLLRAQSERPSPLGARGCTASNEAILEYLRAFDTFFRGVGGTAAIALDRRIAFSGAWGMADLEHRVPVRPETRFFVASVTKAFTGVALLKLAEEGGIDLGAPIQRYVSAFGPASGEPVTPRLLAAHLGGVRHWKPEERDAAFLSRHYEGPLEVVPLFAGDSLVAPPGTRYVYSSPGYNVLAAAIEAASGSSFVDYVTNRVIRPAGLQHTQFDDIRRISPDRARGYSYWYPWFSRQSSDTLWRVPDFDYSVNVGGGNMLSTSEDLTRFGSALLAPGILNAMSLRLLRTPIADGSRWTYGFVVDSDSVGGTVLRITGSDPGYQANLFIYPDHRVVIALLLNSWGIRAQPPPRFADPVARLLAMCLGTDAP